MLLLENNILFLVVKVRKRPCWRFAVLLPAAASVICRAECPRRVLWLLFWVSYLKILLLVWYCSAVCLPQRRQLSVRGSALGHFFKICNHTNNSHDISPLYVNANCSSRTVLFLPARPQRATCRTWKDSFFSVPCQNTLFLLLIWQPLRCCWSNIRRFCMVNPVHENLVSCTLVYPQGDYPKNEFLWSTLRSFQLYIGLSSYGRCQKTWLVKSAHTSPVSCTLVYPLGKNQTSLLFLTFSVFFNCSSDYPR